MFDIQTRQKVLLVLERLRNGETLHEACEHVGISRQTVRRHIGDDTTLQGMLDEALDDSADILADKLINIDAVVSDPKMAGVISKNIQWFLARKRPDRYGDRMIVESVGGIDKEIVELMRAAVNRIPMPVAARPEPPMIDVTPTAPLAGDALLAHLLS